MHSARIFGHQMDEEFGYYYTGVDNASPEVQTNFVEVLGLSGSIDLTEQDGSVFYYSVERQWRFEKVTKISDEEDVEREARNLRRKLLRAGKVIFDADPDYYYQCRITSIVVSCEDGGRLVALISAYCDPYKYRVYETVVSADVSTSQTIELYNDYMAVSPTIVTDSEMALDYTIMDVEYHAVVSQGEHVVDTFVLYEGLTSVTVTGTGHIQFRYRQGAL